MGHDRKRAKSVIRAPAKTSVENPIEGQQRTNDVDYYPEKEVYPICDNADFALRSRSWFDIFIAM
jgi:hypothetical protein